jgi:putative transposase
VRALTGFWTSQIGESSSELWLKNWNRLRIECYEYVESRSERHGASRRFPWPLFHEQVIWVRTKTLSGDPNRITDVTHEASLFDPSRSQGVRHYGGWNRRASEGVWGGFVGRAVGDRGAVASGSEAGGASREVDLREVINAILDQQRTGGQWDMLPRDLLPQSTVNECFTQWRDDGTLGAMLATIRGQVRVQAGREPTPCAACLDTQSVTTTERGGPDRGYDGAEKFLDRRRHLLVDTLGLLIAVVVIGANRDDGAAAPLLLAQVSAEEQLRLSVMFGDNKYRNHLLNAWMAEHRPTWTSKVQSPPPGTKGFSVVRIRWVVERTNALERFQNRSSVRHAERVGIGTLISTHLRWSDSERILPWMSGHQRRLVFPSPDWTRILKVPWNGRSRRNNKDDERTTASSAARIPWRAAHLMLNRLAPAQQSAPFKYRNGPPAPVARAV